MREIYIFGHKKPDTDAVTSAIALANLKNQECIVRLSKNGCMYPAFKAKTVNFVPKTKNNYQQKKVEEKIEEKTFSFEFNINSDVTAKDIMSKASSSRKKV